MEKRMSLTANKLRKFKRILEKTQQATLDQLAAATSKVKTLLEECKNTPDPVDRPAPPYEENKVLVGISQKLERIRKALLRVTTGSYGICTECGGLIEEKRLEAKPTVDTCIDCQRSLEESEEGNRTIKAFRGSSRGRG